MEEYDGWGTKGNGSYDFGARIYYSPFGRFDIMDPLSERRPNISPYAFCGNNPVNRIDPDGRNFIPIGGAAALVDWALITTGVYTSGMILSKNSDGSIQMGSPMNLRTVEAFISTALAVAAVNRVSDAAGIWTPSQPDPPRELKAGTEQRVNEGGIFNNYGNDLPDGTPGDNGGGGKHLRRIGAAFLGGAAGKTIYEGIKPAENDNKQNDNSSGETPANATLQQHKPEDPENYRYKGHSFYYNH